MNVIGVTRGVFLAMDPQTGQILAMVSLPAYDNDAFAQGISTAGTSAFKDPDRPLLNMAIGEQYPPGSTYKLVTGSGALRTARSPRTRRSGRPVHPDRVVGSTGTGTRKASAR